MRWDWLQAPAVQSRESGNLGRRASWSEASAVDVSIQRGDVSEESAVKTLAGALGKGALRRSADPQLHRLLDPLRQVHVFRCFTWLAHWQTGCFQHSTGTCS